MLTLTAREGDNHIIQCGGQLIKLNFWKFRGDSVRVAYDAPIDVQIDREEVYLQKIAAAAMERGEDANQPRDVTVVSGHCA